MSLKIIDSHIHFWDPELFRYSWMKDAPELEKKFNHLDFNRHSNGINVEKLVFVQAECQHEMGLKEVEWVSELANNESKIAGIVAFAPLEKGLSNCKEYLDQISKNQLVKGIRRMFQWEAPGFARDNKLIESVQSLSDYNLTFDICIYHYQMQDAIYLIEKCPKIKFVLDHIGKPNIKENIMEPWSSQLAEMASFPNVFCKLSGLINEADMDHWTEDQLKPYLLHAINSFGVNRIMYGADWPVSLLAASYKQWFSVLYNIVKEFDTGSIQNVFYDNAKTFYQI